MRQALVLGTLFLRLVTSGSGAESTNVSSGPSAANDWVVRNWQSKDGLPQNTVNAIVQTRDGYLWIGTSGGLARFDGVRFRRFGLEDGLRSVQIFRLAEDRDGTLWVGTVGGGLSRWEDGRFTTFGPAEGFSVGTVQALAADRDGSLWIGGERGLVRWNQGTFTSIGLEEGLPTKNVRALAQDTNGALWVSVLGEGLFRGTNGRFAPLERSASSPREVYSLMVDRDGAVWAGFGNGLLWRWRDSHWKLFNTSNGLPSQSFESLAQGPDGAVWLTAQNAGVYRFSEERFRSAGQNELAEERVRVVTVDWDGSVWAGTVAGGLYRLSRRVVQYWGSAAGLAKTSVNSVAEDAEGLLWVMTQDKGVHHLRDGRFSRFREPTNSSKYPFTYASATTSDGSIWAAGEGSLFRFRSGQPPQAYLDPPVRGEAVRALCADGDTLWLGTYYSTLIKWETNGLRIMATNGSFGGGINALVREAEDSLWVGTSSGLYQWDRGKVREWATRGALLSSNIRALHRDPDGTLWIGTLGGGLGRLRNGILFNITTRHGLIDDVISQIVPDDFGHLWLGCNRGIMRLNRQEMDALIEGKASELQPLAFGQNEGMLKEQCTGGHSPTALNTKDGRLLFPTMGGLAEIDPRRLGDITPSMPQPVIEEVLVDGLPRNPSVPLVLSPGSHRIQFSFSAPDLRSGEWIRFRSRLEGLDDDWTHGGSRRTISYAGLRPGRYVFHVAASDSRGVWNANAASLVMVVQPFFWQTYRFASIVVIMAGSAAFVWYRRRVALLVTRRAEQEAFTRQLITAQEGERARLARELHDDITQRLARLAIDAGRVERAGSGVEVGDTMRGVREGLVRLSEDVHSLSYRLHSSLLEDLGLTEALRAECERFARQESIPCHLKLQEVSDALPHETALGLFRVTQEALRNVARHAKASAAQVTLRRLDDGLQLAVHDNGVGFDPSQKRDHVSLGLVGMRERMHLLGGELDIESAPGHGTTIVAWVPLKGKEA